VRRFLTDPGHPAWRALLAAGALANVAALWAGKYLPFTDLPQHVAAIASLRHYGDPAWHVRDYFELQLGRSQYLLYYLAGALLAFPFGTAERANRVLLSLVALALPYALRALLRALGRDERLALFAVPLFWSQSLLIGFFNYVAALPLLLVSLALAVRDAASPSLRRTALLAACAVALFYLHLSAFLLFAPCAAIASLAFAPRTTRAALRSLWWTAPALLCAIAFLASSPVVHPGQIGWTQPMAMSWEPPLEAVRHLPDALLDIWPTDADQLVLVALVCCAAVLAWPSSESSRSDVATRVAASWLAIAALFYFAFPVQVGWLWQLNERYAIAFTLLVPTVLRPARGWRSAVPLAAVALAGLVSAGIAARQVRAFNAEVDGFDRVLSAARPGERLIALIYDRGSRAARFSPYLHFGSYYRARGGGVAAFSFAELPQSPLRYRDATAPPFHPAHWEWEPWQFRNATDGAYYDYVLVRGRVDPFARAGPGPIWHVVAREGLWSLYARR
jgi:hypothetical protein